MGHYPCGMAWLITNTPQVIALNFQTVAAANNYWRK